MLGRERVPGEGTGVLARESGGGDVDMRGCDGSAASRDPVEGFRVCETGNADLEAFKEEDGSG